MCIIFVSFVVAMDIGVQSPHKEKDQQHKHEVSIVVHWSLMVGQKELLCFRRLFMVLLAFLGKAVLKGKKNGVHRFIITFPRLLHLYKNLHRFLTTKHSNSAGFFRLLALGIWSLL